jgi:uncharacterized protein (TIGR02145 family)
MKKLTILTAIFLVTTIFAQNKKEQILQLKVSVDSLIQKVDEKSKSIALLQTNIKLDSIKIDSLSVVLVSSKAMLSEQSNMIIDFKKSKLDYEIKIQDLITNNVVKENNIKELELKIIKLNRLIFELENVTIGNQVWKKENLKVSVFNNGDEIKEAKSPKQWEGFNASKTPCFMRLPNGEYLYNGYVLDDVRGICPEGYRVPSNKDFLTLINFLTQNKQSKKMAVQMLLSYDWSEETEDLVNGGLTDTLFLSTNSSGFGAKQAGFVACNGSLNGFVLNSQFKDDFNGLEKYNSAVPYSNCSFYWTSTKTKSNGDSGFRSRYICSDDDSETIPFYNGIDFGYCSQDEGLSVSESDVKFVEYCFNYGFSIRLIKE